MFDWPMWLINISDPEFFLPWQTFLEQREQLSQSQYLAQAFYCLNMLSLERVTCVYQMFQPRNLAAATSTVGLGESSEDSE